jgi:hypothetical protein
VISFTLNSQPAAGMNIGSTLDVFCKVGKDMDWVCLQNWRTIYLSISYIWRAVDNILTTLSLTAKEGCPGTWKMVRVLTTNKFKFYTGTRRLLGEILREEGKVKLSPTKVQREWSYTSTQLQLSSVLRWLFASYTRRYSLCAIAPLKTFK